MLMLSIQIIAGLLMSLCAVYLHMYLLPGRAATLEDIIARLKRDDWGYDSISYGSLFSEGLEVCKDRTWESINGTKGLWRIFWNVGILVELADYVAATNEASPGLSTKIVALRVKAVRIRVSVVVAFVAHIVTLGSAAGEVVYKAAWGYSEVVARTTFVVQDYCPMHLSRYLCAMATA